MKPIVISFEGLAGGLGRWVRRGLLNRIEGYEKREYAWTSGAKDTNRPCIVVGHSFGCKAAVETADNSTNCHMLLLLDPRMPPFGTGGVVAPKGIRTVCIYQRGLMRGHPVKGAENIELKRVRHTSVPFTDEALKYALEGLRG